LTTYDDMMFNEHMPHSNHPATLRKSPHYASDHRRYEVFYEGQNIGWVIGDGSSSKYGSCWTPVYKDFDGSPVIAVSEGTRADALETVEGNAFRTVDHLPYNPNCRY
jgi:hypothetical protein